MPKNFVEGEASSQEKNEKIFFDEALLKGEGEEKTVKAFGTRRTSEGALINDGKNWYKLVHGPRSGKDKEGLFEYVGIKIATGNVPIEELIARASNNKRSGFRVETEKTIYAGKPAWKATRYKADYTPGGAKGFEIWQEACKRNKGEPLEKDGTWSYAYVFFPTEEAMLLAIKETEENLLRLLNEGAYDKFDPTTGY